MARGGQGLARVAVVVRAGAAPLWWLGVISAGVGVLVPGITGRRIGVLAGAALFLITAAVVALVRHKRYAALAGGAARAGKHDVLQDRAVTVRNWRRGHRWWLLLAFVAALGSRVRRPRGRRDAARRGRGGPSPQGGPDRTAGAGRRRRSCGSGSTGSDAGPASRRASGSRATAPRVSPRATPRPVGRGVGVAYSSEVRGGVRPPGPPRSSSAGAWPSRGWRAWRRAPGRGRGRCRRGP